MLPKEIVHVFPADSDTEQYAENEEELTFLPSFWLKLNELEELTNLLGVYNQITCETKRDGEIIKPYAVVAFGEIDEKISEIAKNFNIKCILVHPDENAINSTVAKEVFEKMFSEDIDVNQYVEENGLKTVNDEGALRSVVEQVIADNPQSVADYQAGKTKAIGFLVGQTMKAMKGLSLIHI